MLIRAKCHHCGRTVDVDSNSPRTWRDANGHLVAECPRCRGRLRVRPPIELTMKESGIE